MMQYLMRFISNNRNIANSRIFNFKTNCESKKFKLFIYKIVLLLINMKNWYRSKTFIKSRTFIVVNTQSGPFIFALRE